MQTRRGPCAASATWTQNGLRSERSNEVGLVPEQHASAQGRRTTVRTASGVVARPASVRRGAAQRTVEPTVPFKTIQGQRVRRTGACRSIGHAMSNRMPTELHDRGLGGTSSIAAEHPASSQEIDSITEIAHVKAQGPTSRHPAVVVGPSGSELNAVGAGLREGDDSAGVGCHGLRYAEIFFSHDLALAAGGAAHLGDRRGTGWLFGDAGTGS